jgi:cytochrome P450 / NADPH-cytochrome P450 reductase
MVDPSYTLEIKQTLTIKPHNFYIRATLRTDGPKLLAIPSLGTSLKSGSTKANAGAGSATGEPKVPLYTLFGSNTGTSENFAQRIASDAASHGTYPPQFLATSI